MLISVLRSPDTPLPVLRCVAKCVVTTIVRLWTVVPSEVEVLLSLICRTLEAVCCDDLMPQDIRELHPPRRRSSGTAGFMSPGARGDKTPAPASHRSPVKSGAGGAGGASGDDGFPQGVTRGRSSTVPAPNSPLPSFSRPRASSDTSDDDDSDAVGGSDDEALSRRRRLGAAGARIVAGAHAAFEAKQAAERAEDDQRRLAAQRRVLALEAASRAAKTKSKSKSKHQHDGGIVGFGAGGKGAGSKGAFGGLLHRSSSADEARSGDWFWGPLMVEALFSIFADTSVTKALVRCYDMNDSFSDVRARNAADGLRGVFVLT